MRSRRLERLAALLIAICVGTGNVRADGFRYPLERRGEMTASLTVRVADPDGKPTADVHFTVTVAGPPTLEVEPARIDDPIEAWAASRSSSRVQDLGEVIWSERVILRQAKAGFLALPAVGVRFRAGPRASWEEARWSNILNEVSTAPAPEPVPLEAPPRSLAPLLAGAGLLGGFLFLGWVLRRRRPNVELSPAEQARREMDLAETAGIAGANLHARLGDAIRGYLGARFQVPVLRQTTPELLAAHADRVPTEARAVLAEFLQRCDLAKFAAIEPSPVECRKTSQLARAILQAYESNVK